MSRTRVEHFVEARVATQTISTSSTLTVPDQAAAARRHVLLIGPAALPLASPAEPHITCLHVACFVEAILAASAENLVQPYDLIVADCTPDQANLTAALTAFRRVHPAGQLVLLCTALQEPLCRAALTAGANDYLILPVTARQIPLLAPESAAVSPVAPAGNGHDHTAARRTPPAAMLSAPPTIMDPAGAQLAPPPSTPSTPSITPTPIGNQITLPLDVQTALLDEVLQNSTDITARALAVLQTHFPWPGTLRIVPRDKADGAPLSPPGVALEQDEADFGFLAVADGAPESRPPGALEAAARWLTAWLLFAQRTRQLRELAITDELSGAYNRRYFMHFVTQLLDKARAGRFRVTMLYFDIDDFKQYNDLYGHAAGDTIIRDMIRLLRHCTRPHDMVARIGGDEFAVVFWDHEPPRQANSQHPRSALAISERFRKAIASHDWRKATNITGQVSVSGGLATFPWDGRTLDTLLAAADANLLRAKQQGKNVIMLRHAEDDEPEKTGGE